VVPCRLVAPFEWCALAGFHWLFVWFLKWDQVAVAQAHSPLVSQYLNVPAGVNLM
jgi:hypothetical protein